MWNDWLSQTRRVYDARASIPFDGHTSAGEVKRCVDALCTVVPNRDARVCDVGCGTGWHLREMADRGFTRLCGIDLSAESIAQAAQRNAHTHALFVWGDVCSYPAQGHYDAVTVFNAVLGSGSQAYDTFFVRRASALLADRGSLVLSFIPQELAQRHAGTFDVTYSESSPARVKSSVDLSAQRSVLTIRQTLDDRALPSELLHLYTVREMASLISSAGLEVVLSGSDDALEPRTHNTDCYLGWIVARRRAHE
jgi:SAM-dependent methyltransferase